MNLQEIAVNVRAGRARETSALVDKAIAEHYDFETIIKDGFFPGIQAMEEQFRRQEILIPEIHLATRALRHGLRQIKRAIAASGAKRRGTVVIGAIANDLEDPQQTIMAAALEGMGLRVVDLGAGVSPDAFIRAAIEEDALLIVCTAALVTALPGMKNLVQALSAARIRDQVKIMLTGAPVTSRFCRMIGADLYAPDAMAVAEMASALY